MKPQSNQFRRLALSTLVVCVFSVFTARAANDYQTSLNDLGFDEGASKFSSSKFAGL